MKEETEKFRPNVELLKERMALIKCYRTNFVSKYNTEETLSKFLFHTGQNVQYNSVLIASFNCMSYDYYNTCLSSFAFLLAQDPSGSVRPHQC